MWRWREDAGGGCGESLVLGSKGKRLNQPKGGSTQASLLQQAQPSGFLGPGQLEERRAKADQVCLEGCSRQGGIGGCGEDARGQSQDPLGGRGQRGAEPEECSGSTGPPNARRGDAVSWRPRGHFWRKPRAAGSGQTPAPLLPAGTPQVFLYLPRQAPPF